MCFAFLFIVSVIHAQSQLVSYNLPKEIATHYPCLLWKSPWACVSLRYENLMTVETLFWGPGEAFSEYLITSSLHQEYEGSEKVTLWH